MHRRTGTEPARDISRADFTWCMTIISWRHGIGETAARLMEENPLLLRLKELESLERLVEKGKIVAKKAYADWSRFQPYTAPLHEAAIELIEIPRRAQSGKNSADIRLCVDAMDLAYSKEHINTFVIVSGDSDFSPLVSKLKELGKHVIGLVTRRHKSCPGPLRPARP